MQRAMRAIPSPAVSVGLGAMGQQIGYSTMQQGASAFDALTSLVQNGLRRPNPLPTRTCKISLRLIAQYLAPGATGASGMSSRTSPLPLPDAPSLSSPPRFV
jgi:hypothetical protein